MKQCAIHVLDGPVTYFALPSKRCAFPLTGLARWFDRKPSTVRLAAHRRTLITVCRAHTREVCLDAVDLARFLLKATRRAGNSAGIRQRCWALLAALQHHLQIDVQRLLRESFAEEEARLFASKV